MLEIFAAIALMLITASFFVFPFLHMPMQFTSFFVIALILIFVGFAALVWKEKPADEREAYIQNKLGRISFLVGICTLIFSISFQAIKGEVDPWLIFVLCAMLLSKILGRFFTS